MIGHVDKYFTERGCNGTVVIYSIDTDVLILAIHHFIHYSHVVKMWVETGRSDPVKATSTHRFVPVHSICEELDPELPPILPAIHALSGCDFYYKGKKSVMKLIQKRKNSKPGCHVNMTLFRNLTIFTTGSIEAAVNAARPIVALLYDPSKAQKSLRVSLNSLRTQLCISTSDPMSKLPPSEPVFVQHVKRAVWQTKFWVTPPVTLEC